MDAWQWKGDATTGAGRVSIPKGAPISAYSAALTSDATWTAAATSIAGFNSVLLQTVLSSAGVTATNLIYGAFSSGGTMQPIFDKDTSAQMTTGLVTASKTQRFSGLPDYIAVTTALTAGTSAAGSVMVSMVALNL